MISARLTSPSPSTEVSYVTGQTPTPDADDEHVELEAEPNESRPHAQVSQLSSVPHWSQTLSFVKAFNDVIYKVKKSCYSAKIVTDYVCWVNLQNYQSCFESAIEQIRNTIADLGFRFYIGITEDPIRRWDELELGKSYD